MDSVGVDAQVSGIGHPQRHRVHRPGHVRAQHRGRRRVGELARRTLFEHADTREQAHDSIERVFVRLRLAGEGLHGATTCADEVGNFQTDGGVECRREDVTGAQLNQLLRGNGLGGCWLGDVLKCRQRGLRSCPRSQVVISFQLPVTSYQLPVSSFQFPDSARALRRLARTDGSICDAHHRGRRGPARARAAQCTHSAARDPAQRERGELESLSRSRASIGESVTGGCGHGTV